MLTNLMSPQNPFNDFPAPVKCVIIGSGMYPAFTLGAIKSNIFAKKYILWLGVKSFRRKKTFTIKNMLE